MMLFHKFVSDLNGIKKNSQEKTPRARMNS